jgi:putative spermidine/putrescine transport system substrate-binding protein
MKQTLLRAGAALCLLSFGSPTVAAGADDLVAAAKEEGALTFIALPRDWCGYGALIDSFKAKYGIAVNELNPDGGSGDEVEAIKANKDNKGPQAPDVIDVGHASSRTRAA